MQRLRLLFRIVIVAGLVTSTQSLLVIQGAFHLNRAAIAEAFCVNKDDPHARCDGMCELSRRMESHHENETERGAAVLDLALAVAATESEPLALPGPPSRTSIETPRDGLAAARGVAQGVFRPPRGEA